MEHFCQFKFYRHDPVTKQGTIAWKQREDHPECCGATAHFKVELLGENSQSIWYCAKHYDFWCRFCGGQPDPAVDFDGETEKVRKWSLKARIL